MNEILNSPESVGHHIERLKKARDLESYCTGCGDCCHASIRINKSKVMIPELPCKYLVLKSNGQYRCSVYQERFEKAPWCQDLFGGMIQGTYPVTCNYTKSMGGYAGSVELGDEQYYALREDLQKTIRTAFAEITNCFHPEDYAAFLTADLKKSSVIGVGEDSAYDWVNATYARLPEGVRDMLSRKLEDKSPEREYIAQLKDSNLIRSLIIKSIPKLESELGELDFLISEVSEKFDIPVTNALSQAVDVVKASRLITSRTQSYESVVFNRWLLEKAVSPEVMQIVDSAYWWRFGDSDIPNESLLLGKALELIELRVNSRDIQQASDNSPPTEFHSKLYEDITLFKALSTL